jgi:hypothetical protein
MTSNQGLNKDVVEKQVAAMAQDDLDAVVAVSPENVAYVIGFLVPSQPSLRWRHAAAVTTRDGRTAVLCVDMEETTIKSRLPDEDVRVWAEFEDNAMPVLVDLLRDLGLASARIGMETDYLPARDMDTLRSLLPDVHWERSQDLFARLRMHKTKREEEVPLGVCLQTLQRHGAASRIADQPFQLVPTMRRHRDIGVQRKPVHAGTAGAGEGRALAFIAKPRAHAAHLLPGALPKGNTPPQLFRKPLSPQPNAS